MKSDSAKAWVKDALPIRIARSALAPNVPSADLFVTAGHAVLVDGVLVAAGSLVNGSTIAIHDASEMDTLEYFNIKLERHDVIFAQGAACETLLNVREHALNFAEYTRLYGMPQNNEAPCLPRLAYDGGRSALKGHLRSALSPLLDRRAPIDILRDRLDERAHSLAI